MPRNLDRRVEILFPVQDLARRHLRDEILETYLRDNMKTRVLAGDGSWTHIWPKDGDEPLNAQEWFVARAREAAVDESEHA